MPRRVVGQRTPQHYRDVSAGRQLWNSPDHRADRPGDVEVADLSKRGDVDSNAAEASPEVPNSPSHSLFLPFVGSLCSLSLRDSATGPECGNRTEQKQKTPDVVAEMRAAVIEGRRITASDAFGRPHQETVRRARVVMSVGRLVWRSVGGLFDCAPPVILVACLLVVWLLDRLVELVVG